MLGRQGQSYERRFTCPSWCHVGVVMADWHSGITAYACRLGAVVSPNSRLILDSSAVSCRPRGPVSNAENWLVPGRGGMRSSGII